MKYLISALVIFASLVFFSPKALAANSSLDDKTISTSSTEFFQKKINHYKNRVLAYYTSGEHGIVGESGITHTGIDLVVEASHGCKNKLIQWFYGTSDTEGLHGEKSVWTKVGTNAKKCHNGEILVKDARENGWGDYFEPGMDYCVKTTNFQLNGNAKNWIYNPRGGYWIMK